MTRNAPPSGYGPGEGNGDQQAPYRSYYGQDQTYSQQQQSSYGGYQQTPPVGSAQSYYGQNDQPYQQYPNESANTWGSQSQQSAPHTPQPSYQQPQPPQQYGQYQDQSYPAYGQPPAAPHYGPGLASGPEVDAFKSHFEQPHGPIPPNQYQYAPQQPPQALGSGSANPTPSQEDRGVMGALAGGAAGGFAGHKANHGFLGAIGGAIGGSMLEDVYKKKHKKDKKNRRDSSSSSSSSDSDSHKHKHDHHNSAPMDGNFSASSRGTRIEGHSTLVAECADVNGHHRESRIDLNDCFTNSGGELLWQRHGNFAASARHLRLADDGRVMETELGDGRGGWHWQRVRLDERISNDNGHLVML
ncbi:Hypothetical protein R9X50_00288700 [Acrodontium crateriforme]|uniref:Cyanovirin-N domain-containing protein n=1 Tax=Acrodontium crateriforme TaxID=150365 RepID=A0AAQ3M1W2_9PEZI|nr:Hypothetical protein R9X50_00288700 [Acrodontium crateriforme]